MYPPVGAQNSGMFNVLTQGVSNAVSGAGSLVKKGTNTIGLTTPATMGGRRASKRRTNRNKKRTTRNKKRTNRNKKRTNRNKNRTNRNKNRSNRK